MVVNETVLYKTGSLWWFWGVGLGFALLAALLTFVIYNHVIILTTSFMGAYLFWRGISMYLGGFPNEFNLIDQVAAGATDSVNPWFYAYLIAIILSTAGGAYLQYVQLSKMNEAEKHPYARLR